MRTRRRKILPGGFSLTFRLSLGITLMVSLLTAAAGFSTYMQNRSIFMTNALESGWSTISMIRTTALSQLGAGVKNYYLLDDIIKNLEQDKSIQKAVIYDDSGKVLLSLNRASGTGNTGEVQFTDPGKYEKDQVTQIKDSKGRITALFFAVPVVDSKGKVYGHISLTKDFSLVQARLDRTMYYILAEFVLATLACLFIIRLVILRAVNRPVQALLRTAERVAVGDFSTKLPVYANDEMGQLARGFNTMIDHLGVLFKSIRTTATEMNRASTLIAQRSEAAESNPGEEVDISRQVEMMREINSNAKRLWRLSDKLNSLALQFRIEAEQPDRR